MGRARRRADARRMKQRARDIFPDWPDAYKHADCLAFCSCESCGNPRHHFGQRTRQEQKADLAMTDMDTRKEQ